MADSSSKKIKLNVKDNVKKEVESVEVKGDDIIKKNYSSFMSPRTNPVLPPETWDQIFSDFSSTDFISVINAAPEWNQLLGSRKTTELFSKVFPYLLPYLNTAELLTCRQVTKTWKAGADQVISSIWSSCDTWFDSFHETNYVYSTVKRISKNYVFGYTEKLELAKFVRILRLKKDKEDVNAVGNPFLTRSLEIDRLYGQGGRVQNYFFSEIGTTLFHYGNYIWRLKYITKDFYCVSYLSSYLKHLPHLKILELSCDLFERWPSVGYTDYFKRITDLPPLPELECLDVTYLKKHWLTTFFLDTYGAQLSALAIHGSWFSSPEIKIGNPYSRLSKLKKLRVVDADAGKVSSLSQMRWPLETLEIHLTMSKPSEIQRILETVCSFKDTLTCLQIQVDKVYYMNLDLETDDNDVSFCDNGSEQTEITAFIEWKFITLAQLAFEKLPKLEKIVFWTKREKRKLVQSIMNRQTLIIN